MSDSNPAQAANHDEHELDPETTELLKFEPVPRKRSQENGWTPEQQRAFIARLAVHGSIGRACGELGKDRSGVTKLYNSPEGASFRGAWHAAIDLAKRRTAERAPKGPPPAEKPPTIDHRRKTPVRETGEDGDAKGPAGQVLNECGEWEDEDSLQRRAEEARDSISNKLLQARRLYLREISECPGKRAAFEILTELPIDWDRAERLQPQADEPWRKPNMRNGDMLLTAEAGWLGDMAHGRNRIAERMAELRQAMDEYHAEHGLPPIDWENERFND